MNWQVTVLELLSASVFRPLVLVAAAALVLWIFRIEHPASKHAIWTAVLIGMLMLPFLSLVMPHLEFEALPQGTLSRLEPLDDRELRLSSASDSVAGPVALTVSEESAKSPAAGTIPIEPSPVAPGSVSSQTILLWVYAAGLIGFAVYRLIGWILMRLLLSRSVPSRSGVLRESLDVSVPIAVGIVRPVIILPIGWRQWSAAERRAVFAHEFAHLRRGDARILGLSRLVKCLFWFHPLSWWVARRISELAEMACDAAALERVDPGLYSRILLNFASVVNRRGHRARLPGLAMAGRSRLSRRIEQVFAVSNGRRRKLKQPVTVLALVGMPGLCIASTLGLTEGAARPLRQVQEKVTERIETVAQVASTSGVLAAIAEAVPPITAAPPEPVQSAATTKTFLDQYCVNCHTPMRRSGNLSLQDQDLGQIRSNAALWERVVLRLRSGLDPKAIPGTPGPSPSEVRSVIQWLESELDRDAMPYMPAPGAHRLNRTEYGNAIHDLLRLDVNPALLLPADDSTSGFDNMTKALPMTPPLEAAYSAAAERVVDLATSNAASREVLFACRPSRVDYNQDEDIRCARQFIEAVAPRAFRRPLTDSETSALVDVYIRSASMPTWWFFDGGIREILKTMLSDSRFLYRTEAEPANVAAGQTYRISDLELASRLSYFLWSRGPDDQLLDIASRGQLSNPAVLEAETRRMLNDPRAESLTANFAGQWLSLRRLQQAGPMPQYPEFDALQQAMKREAELFFASVVQGDRNVVDLLTANYTFLNERLARHYGINNVFGDDFRRVELGPAFDVRRGLLGKAALLTLTSRPDRTSLTTRAIWVWHTFLGVRPPDPPPNVKPMGPKVAPMRETMEREEQAGAACVSCHRMIDPIGIALDNFDQAGKWRTEDSSQPINPATELLDGTPIKGVTDLRNALVARSDQFVQTLTERLLTYALGRPASYQDMPLIRQIRRDAARDNYRFSSIIQGIVKSPTFQMNTKL